MTMPQTRHYEMKVSGFGDIREMPKHWQMLRIKNRYSVLCGATPSENSENWDGDINWIGPADMGDFGKIKEGKRTITQTGYDSCGTHLIPAGSVILSTRAPIGKVQIAEAELCTNQGCKSMVRMFTDDSTQFLAYYLFAIKERLQEAGTGTTFKELSTANLKNMPFLLPSPQEQTAIAAYLDEKCATIDAIVTEAKATIDEYKAWKASVISEIVTKGLNPNAEMKDSGVEWIGEIPKGWKIKAAKYCVEIHHGSDPVTEGDVPVYGSGADSFKTCGEYKEGPAVLVGRKGATLHIPHYIIGRYWNVDTAFDVKAHPDFSLKFYYYLAICFDYKFYISQTTLPGMTQTNYRNMPIPVPPLSEQASIVSYLDRKCSLIDGIILEKEELIKELEHYKRSLIFEAVTGKRRVC